MKTANSTGTNTLPFTTATAEELGLSFEPVRHGKGKMDRNGNFVDKEFIGWDGEGWTDHRCEQTDVCDGSKCSHHYCLFGNSRGDSISGESLSTLDCLRLLLVSGRNYPNAIHIGFAFSYDVNLIIRDLPVKKIQQLKEETQTTWKGFHIEHIPKKWFQVSGVVDGKKSSIRIQDIFSFFGCSFIKALKGWSVGTPQEIEKVATGKDARGSFSLSELDSFVRPYWESEQQLLVGLANKLRENLFNAGLKITGWYGPGNIATFLYKKHGTKDAMDFELPRPIVEASQYAYAGGRFEGFRAGFHDSNIYSADINSAYPYALSRMPDLRSGKWRLVQDAGSISKLRPRVGLFHVEFRFVSDITRKARQEGFPLPLFNRRKTGHVWYPVASKGWYHAPEFAALMDLWEESKGRLFSRFEIRSAWIYDDDGSYPFAWVSEMYDQRAAWKAQGNPSQLALKLGINSLYGKLAQRIGSKDGKPPTWHQLVWAGAITATCRAMLYDVALTNWDSLLGVETDGIYCTKPINGIVGNTGTALGQWELDSYSGILFLQNGVYWLRDKEGDWKPPKSRGIPQSHLDFGKAMSALSSGTDLVAYQNYFIGYGTALHRDPRQMASWNRWGRGAKTFEFGGNGKRFHNQRSCHECAAGMGLHEGLHTLSLRLEKPEDALNHSQSYKHVLPWMEDEYALTAEMELQRRWYVDD